MLFGCLLGQAILAQASPSSPLSLSASFRCGQCLSAAAGGGADAGGDNGRAQFGDVAVALLEVLFIGLGSIAPSRRCGSIKVVAAELFFFMGVVSFGFLYVHCRRREVSSAGALAVDVVSLCCGLLVCRAAP